MFKIIAFFITTLLPRLYLRVGILLTCGKYVHAPIILLKEEVWAHKTSLTPPLSIEVHMSSHVYVCCGCLSILPLSVICLLDFGAVPSVWLFLLLILYQSIWFSFWFLVFNATFSNISAILWLPVLVVEEAEVPGENHRPWASNW